jgi:hypothetical protein
MRYPTPPSSLFDLTQVGGLILVGITVAAQDLRGRSQKGPRDHSALVEKRICATAIGQQLSHLQQNRTTFMMFNPWQ